MEIIIIVGIILIILMLFSIMQELYHIRKDIYWWREDWEAVNKIGIGKTSLKEQAGLIKRIVVWFTDPKE